MYTNKFTVTEAESGQRIDKLCSTKFPEISRSRWTNYGEYWRDGIDKPPKTKAKAGDDWQVSCEEELTLGTDIEPWDTPIKILAESETWVAIEKPYGVSVHPSLSEPTHTTVINALVHHFGKDLSESFDEVEGRQLPRPGLVHRLDKTTTGILLVAKTNATHKYLQEHWKECEKFYTAVVEGMPPKAGNIEGSIGRDPHDRKRMAVSNHLQAKPAQTKFELTSLGKEQATLRVQIMTGRTHQIRVHLSSIGFPIVGDVLYKGTPSDRIYLHATELRFPNPDKDGEFMIVQSEVDW